MLAGTSNALQSPTVTTFIERLALMNYRSIAHCDVELQPLTVVVGRNGSGKSNFIDSLHFVSDALSTSLEYAILKRGGIRTLVHRRGEQRFVIELDFNMASGNTGAYRLAIDRGRVALEGLQVTSAGGFIAGYQRRGTGLKAQVGSTELLHLPKVLHDRLALVALSGDEAFRESFDALTAMRYYRFEPDAMRQAQDPDEGIVLRENGSNIPGVWRRMQKANPRVLDRLTRYLAAIVPELTRIRRVTVGPKESLRFDQAAGDRNVTFDATSMSDGTLRALGALVASRQNNGLRNATVIAIEEPETALHPGAVAALMDALHEASGETQILMTSHSPDVLDHVDLDSDALLVTEYRDGATVVAGVDAASREAIRRHLYTPGDLLRMDQLQPAPASR